MNTRICVCVGQKKLDEALIEAAEAVKYADVVEVRLDYLDNPSVSSFINEVSAPLLFTNRAEWEGGNFSGNEEERVGLLEEAAASNAAYVDLELLSPESSWASLTRTAAGSDTKIICSWHNFHTTPPPAELQEKLEQMQKSGAHIGKIVTMANDFQDVLRVISLQTAAAELRFPLIAFCMGEPGVISRVATTSLGGYMTYCAPDSGTNTAPYQVKVGVMRSIFKQLEEAG